MVEFSDAMSTNINTNTDINTSTNNDTTNDQVCPICQQLNQCVISRGQGSINDCWCMHLEEKIPDELLNMVPADLRGKACVCENCLQRYWAGELNH